MEQESAIESILPRAVGLDMMLPAQFTDLSRSAERTPEQRLLLAILEDAINCWRGAVGATGWCADAVSRRMKVAREAQHWLFDDDADPFVSFHNCCDALGVDADWLRDKLRKWSAQIDANVGSTWRKRTHVRVAHHESSRRIVLSKRFAEA